MITQASVALPGRNPDVLTCIANLSNDEVFTPPEFANNMLNTMADAWAKANGGEEIWTNPSVTFLDPFTKSGVFLREITRRLTTGLEAQIPDLETRVDHILTKQVFGIGITALTSLVARRSVYCSKWADGEHSIASSFDNPDGNIWFERLEHTWEGGTDWVYTTDKQGNQVTKLTNGRCRYCGARQTTLDRGEGLETHAYAFIHTDDTKARVAELFGADMQFDVVIGNPPYQLQDGGGEGSSAIPIYQRFVQAAKKLEPRFLSLVIPARWYSGGKGLDEFRSEMLGDTRIAEIHDYPETDMVFPGVNIRGGVCYFLWDKDHVGDSIVVNYSKAEDPVVSKRPLLEPGNETFVRYNRAVSILRKVQALQEETYDKRVQSRNPFGISSNFAAFSTKKTHDKSILLFRSRRGSSADKEVYVSADQVVSNLAFKDRVKVLVSKASPGGDEYPHAIFSTPLIGPVGSVCTETYLIVDFVDSELQGSNLISYMSTRFFRFLVSLIKTTQNISKGSFAFVPVQDLSKSWSDSELFDKYGISEDEAAFVDTLIRPMNLTPQGEI